MITASKRQRLSRFSGAGTPLSRVLSLAPQLNSANAGLWLHGTDQHNSVSGQQVQHPNDADRRTQALVFRDSSERYIGWHRRRYRVFVAALNSKR